MDKSIVVWTPDPELDGLWTESVRVGEVRSMSICRQLHNGSLKPRVSHVSTAWKPRVESLKSRVVVSQVGGNTLGFLGCAYDQSGDGNHILAYNFTGSFYSWRKTEQGILDYKHYMDNCYLYSCCPYKICCLIQSCSNIIWFRFLDLWGCHRRRTL